MTTGVLEPQLQDVDRPHPHGAAQRSALMRFLPIIKPYRWYFIGSVVVSIIGTLTGLVIPLVTQHIIDGPIKAGHFADVWWPAVLVLVLGSIDAFGIWIRRYLISHPSSQFEISARAQIFAKLQHLSIASHDGWDSGQLLSRAIADLSSMRRFVAFIGPFLIINSVTIVAGIGVLLVLSWPLGVVVLVMAVPLVLVCIKFESLYQIVSRRAQDQGGDLTTTVEESIQGIRVLKAFGRSPFAAKGFLKQAAQLRVTELTKVRYLAVLWTVIVSVPSLGIGVALAYGTYSIVHGTMTIGTLVAAMSVVAFLLWPIEAFGFLLAELNNARTAADRYWEIMDTPETISDSIETVPLPNPLRGTLTFDHVGFTFPDASRDQLHDINLTIEPGETVALVGITGSGKTAMTNLVARLYDVSAGAILLDGIDIRTLKLNDLRSVMAVAFEDPVLFSASVRENVALGHPSATMHDIREALEVARAADFVEELPWGIETRIGEQGMSLSGGQRQRLALARAMLGKPRILVLDDPLSALDVNTEAQVQEALRRILTQSTTLLVAHRPSTAALADRVAHLEDGRITEVGTHEALLATSARYRHVMGSVDE